MVEGWKEFFGMFPQYRNTFDQVKVKGEHVFVLGSAYWSEKEPYDPVIWRARIVNSLIAEWRIFEDTSENRKQFHF
jgi:hypothetical protein